MSNEAIEKIKKLLRLGQSPNPHEAALAMERAFELASRHNIDVASLDLDDKDRKLIGEYFPIGWRMSLIKKRVLGILQNYFSVNVVVCRPKVCFIGTPSDVEIAHYVFEFLARVAEENLRTFKRENPRARKLSHDNFVTGFFWGISNKLRAAREQFQVEDSKTAIVLAEEARREAKEKELFPNAYELNVPDPKRRLGALTQGFIRGKEVTITPAVGSSGNGTKLLGV